MTKLIFSRTILAEFGRFLVAGGVNTAVWLALFNCLLFVAPYDLAYALSWLAGLAFLAAVYPNHVFQAASTDLTSRATIVLIYIVVFIIGFAALSILTLFAGISPRLAIFVVLPVTTILNYAFMSLFFRRTGTNA